MATFGFAKHERLRTSAEFRRVFDEKCSQANGWLVVYVAPNDLPFTRLGLSVSRKFGNAVRRNRFKRLCREAFRHAKTGLPSGLDLILLPKAGAMPTFSQLKEALPGLVTLLAQRLRHRAKKSASPETGSGGA